MIMHIEAATKADLPALTKLSQCCLRRRLSSRQIQRFSVAAFQEPSRIGRSASFWLQMKVRRCLEWLFFYTRSQLRLGGESRYLKIWLLALRLRGGGVGSHLLQSAVAVAEAAGCLRITLFTDQQNLSSQRFYKRHGFAPSSMVPMHLHLAVSQS